MGLRERRFLEPIRRGSDPFPDRLEETPTHSKAFLPSQGSPPFRIGSQLAALISPAG